MIVAVGGQTRNVGKTRAMCEIIRATPEIRWTAVKLTSHLHPPNEADSTDTARYLAAGAAAARLLTADQPVGLPDAACLIIESNSILNQLTPNVLIFIADSDNPDFKDSARRARSCADFIVDRNLNPDVLEAIRARIIALRSLDLSGSPCPPRAVR